jgi:hypothetical protein
MKIKSPLPTAICVAALILGASSGAPAKETKTETSIPKATASPAAKAKAIPYRGNVASIDASVKTFTVGRRIIKVTDQTKITKQGAAATMADITVGEKVSGSYWKRDDGSLEAKNIKIGAKVEKAAPMTNAQHKEGRTTKASPSP